MLTTYAGLRVIVAEDEPIGAGQEDGPVGAHQDDGARAGIDASTGSLVAFLLAFDYVPGHWWPDQVGPALHAAGLERWTEDAVEVMELATDPAHQGRGLGRALLAHLATTTARRTTLLSTDPDNPARRLYGACGYRELVPDFRYPVTGAPAVVLGALNPPATS